ncbi:hypothetical protein ACIQTT_05420 [Microbacterium sp. NPDC090225]|uniref:hypothetical protein n=1 Tax=Microbacterium sp. NPDC090225 TaxID=3364207 RepID=UPI0037FA641B
MTDQSTTDRRPCAQRRNTRPWVWFVVVIVLVLLVAAGIVIWQSQSRADSAEDAAHAYLRALESGESSAVQGTGVEVSDEALQAFDGADSLVSEATVISVDQTGSSATAHVSFVLGETEHEADLALVRSDGRWVPDGSGLAEVTVSTTVGSAVSIGDTVLEASDALSLIPAVYTVAAAPTAYLTGSIAVVALPGATDHVEVDASLRPEATEAAQERLDELLEACAAETALPADGCGIRIPWGTEFRTVDDAAFRIETMPTLVLTDDGASFTATGGKLVATLTGTAHDGSAPRTTTYRSENWAVRGDVAFSGDEMTLTVW